MKVHELRAILEGKPDLYTCALWYVGPDGIRIGHMIEKGDIGVDHLTQTVDLTFNDEG